jgi:hypothetical protein
MTDGEILKDWENIKEGAVKLGVAMHSFLKDYFDNIITILHTKKSDQYIKLFDSILMTLKKNFGLL